MGREIERDFGWRGATALVAALLSSGCTEDAERETAARARLDGELDGSVESGVDGGLMDAGPTRGAGAVAEIAAAAPPGCTPQSCTLPNGCPGRRSCTNGSYLGPCVGVTTGPDTTCDGIDDNCNGTIDEGATAASCNDGLSCTVDSCNMTTHACVNQPFGVLCTTGISDCTIGICTNAAGVSNAEFPYITSDPLVVPTGVPVTTGCTYRARHNWCTNTYDSCNCNGPEMCVAQPRLGPGGVSGCVSAPVAAAGSPPMIYAACDTDNIACTSERACCEPAGGGYCRTDTLQNQANPTLYAARLAACAAPGGITDTWPVVPGFPYTVGPVVCSPVNPLGAPSTNRCQNDGNPCTTITCNETAGGTCTVANRPAMGPAEQFISPVTGTLATSAACGGGVPGTFGCSEFSCNGTSTCTSLVFPHSSSYECTASSPPYGAADDPGHCATPQCQSGLCNTIAVPNATNCDNLFPASCGTGAATCAADNAFWSREWPDLPDGCRPPAGYCYLFSAVQDPNNGILDGQCVPNAYVSANNRCLYCNAAANPFDLTRRPAGTECNDDFNPCTIDVCGADGSCRHDCISSTECSSCVPY